MNFKFILNKAGMLQIFGEKGKKAGHC